MRPLFIPAGVTYLIVLGRGLFNIGRVWSTLYTLYVLAFLGRGLFNVSGRDLLHVSGGVV